MSKPANILMIDMCSFKNKIDKIIDIKGVTKYVLESVTADTYLTAYIINPLEISTPNTPI
ncbi:hypothetical protein PMEGAPL128_58910 [Priestia megaterium]